MGIFQSDLIIITALRAAIADIRANKFLADDMLKDIVSDKLTKDAYGQAEVERQRAFLNKEIHVFNEHRPPDTVRYPCVILSIGGGAEDSRQALSNGYGSSEMDINLLGGAVTTSPKVIVEDITATSYDYLTGYIAFPNTVNFSELGVYEDMYLFDTVNNKHYQIRLVLSNQEIMIDPLPQADAPNLTKVAIYPTKQIVKNTSRSVKMWENHTLHLLASHQAELLQLYNLITYALIRYNKTLFDARGFTIASYSYSEIYRASPGGEGDPNNLYGRDISIKGLVSHCAIETTSPVIVGINTIADMCGTETPDAIKEQVSQQGWDMCVDCDESETEDESI